VAVIELEKLANGKAVLQITGDEDVYGIETIIEPTEEVRVNAGTSTARTVVNVWAWPSVQYVYSPYYTVWVSPWHWYSRPIWWYSWRPIAYYDYYSYWYPYRRHYTHCYTHRVVYARQIYRPHRTTSHVYYKRHETRIVSYRSNHRDDRNRYSDNHDRNRRTRDDHNWDNGKTKRDYSTVNRTPVVRERGSDEKKKSTIDANRQHERKQTIERKPEVMQRGPVKTTRPEVRNKPVVREKSSPRQERTPTVRTNKSSQPREVRSVEKSVRSKSGGEVKRSGGNDKGRGKKD
jgi:hypothetical protein